MRIKFDKELQVRIFNKISEKMTFKELGSKLNLSWNTLKRWRNGKYSVPYNIFNQIKKIVPEIIQFEKEGKILKKNWGASKGGLKAISKINKDELKKRLEYARSRRTFSYKEINLCIVNSLSALEIFGVVLGDGCLSKIYLKREKRYRYYVFITGNLQKDKAYLISYIKPLIENTFQVKVRIRERYQHNCINLIIEGRPIFWWFVKNGVPIGKKGKYLKIPNNLMLMENSKLNYLIRGLFDTDGCISARKDEGYKYPHLIITSISEILREQIKYILRRQGFTAYTHSKDVVIRGNENFKKWFILIGSRNQRNLNRYQEWLKTGKIYCGPVAQSGRSD